MLLFIDVVYTFNFQVKCTDGKVAMNALKVKLNVINLTLDVF